MKTLHTRLLATIVLGFSLQTASAVEIEVWTLPSAAPLGNINFWVGPDLLFGTPDDVVFPPYAAAPGGLNPLGSTASTLNTDPTQFGLPPTGSVVGFFTGSSTAGSVLGDQLIIGTNEITASNSVNLVNFFSDAATFTPAEFPPGTPLLNLPYTASLNTSQPSTLTLGADNSFALDLLLDYNDGTTTGVFTFKTVVGRYLTVNQDPNVVFAGEPDVADFFAGAIPFLPAGWKTVATDAFFFDSASFPGFGSAFGTAIYVSFDDGAIPAVVPVPAALPLLAAGLLSLVTLRRKR